MATVIAAAGLQALGDRQEFCIVRARKLDKAHDCSDEALLAWPSSKELGDCVDRTPGEPHV
jgi:hypothetical protein